MVQKKYEDALWSELENHPDATEEIISIARRNVKVAECYGADRFIYTRNEIQSIITLLNMGKGEANGKGI